MNEELKGQNMKQEKQKGTQIPQGMLDVWEYEHTEMIGELAETRRMIDTVKRK